MNLFFRSDCVNLTSSAMVVTWTMKCEQTPSSHPACRHMFQRQTGACSDGYTLPLLGVNFAAVLSSLGYGV